MTTSTAGRAAQTDTATKPARKSLWERLRRPLVYLLLISFTLVWLMPVFSTLITSVRTMDDIRVNGFWSIPSNFTLSNFSEAWTAGRVNQYALNSFIITIPALIGMLFLSSLAAYALARFRFRGNRLIYFVFVAGMLLPFQILMLPVFRLTNAIGLYDTYWGLIAFHIAFQLGFCTFVLTNFMKGVSEEITDAARVDGCGEFRIYYRIMLPLTLPAMAALATLQFTWIFNDYLWAIVLLRQERLKPVTAGLATLMGQYQTNWPLLVAGSLIATLPTIVVFLFLQRYFIAGLTLGATKG
jgi:multiple sugar transport system permease protein